MKKVIIITILMTVIAALFIGGSVCYAEESQTNYYYVVKGNELSIRVAANEESKVALHIPSTYAFEYVEKVEGFVKIRYNGYEGYVSEVYFNQYCKPVTDKWGDSPYFHTVSLNKNNVSGDNLTLYDKDNKEPTAPLPKSMITIEKVYGYYHNESGYYFLIDATIDVLGAPVSRSGYIKASDTTLADFSKDSISDSAGYIAETTPDEQTPSGDDTPTINPGVSGDTSTQPASNNFERYVLIAVIAVLCIVIIILIFAPNKSKRKS